MYSRLRSYTQKGSHYGRKSRQSMQQMQCGNMSSSSKKSKKSLSREKSDNDSKRKTSQQSSKQIQKQLIANSNTQSQNQINESEKQEIQSEPHASPFNYYHKMRFGILMDIYYKILCKRSVDEVIKREWAEMSQEEQQKYNLMKEAAEEIYQKQKQKEQEQEQEQIQKQEKEFEELRINNENEKKGLEKEKSQKGKKKQKRIQFIKEDEDKNEKSEKVDEEQFLKKQIIQEEEIEINQTANNNIEEKDETAQVNKPFLGENVVVTINYCFSIPEFRNDYKMVEKVIRKRFPKIDVVPEPLGGRTELFLVKIQGGPLDISQVVWSNKSGHGQVNTSNVHLLINKIEELFEHIY